MVGKEVGPYRILEKIGQGGMGIVYKGIHTKLEQEVAIKVLSPVFSQDPSMGERFFKEAKIQAKFSHPNVVNILNYLEDEGNVFLVMEYVKGETLENRLKRAGRLPIEKAVSISLSVLEALDFMHSKDVIHRDIKPSNIMSTDSGLVKVTDFGIAKVIGEKGQTRTGMVGSFSYMSPEQILGEETSVVSDIYSFGITFYQMVTGRVPFDGDSEYTIMKGHLQEKPLPPWEINSNVSEEVGRVILKAIAKSPKDRYQNVKEFAEDLKTVIKKPEEAKIQPQIPIKARSWKILSLRSGLDKRRFLIVLLGLGITLLIIIFFDRKPESELEPTRRPIPERGAVDISPSTISPTQPKSNPPSEISYPHNESLEETHVVSPEGNTGSKEVKKEEQLSKFPLRRKKEKRRKKEGRFSPKRGTQGGSKWKIRK